jgi:hypothetical protein
MRGDLVLSHDEHYHLYNNEYFGLSNKLLRAPGKKMHAT